MFNKILVNLDEQHEHLQLLEKAARLVQPGGHLELFCATWQALIGGASLLNDEAQRGSRHAWLNQCEGRLERLAQRIRLPEVEIGTDVCWDEQRAEAVVRKCLRYHPDLLLHPLSSHSGLLHHLLAPEDWALLRDAPVPVLLGRDRSWASHPRLAVALNPFHLKDEPEELDLQLLGLAHRLVRLLDGELHVVHTFSTLPQAAIFDEHRVIDFERLQTDVRAEHQARMSALLAPFSGEAGAPELHLLEGELHQTLPAFCHQQQIDLLLMGNIERSLLEHLLLGSSAERVLDRLECDLLVLKPQDFVCPIDA